MLYAFVLCLLCASQALAGETAPAFMPGEKLHYSVKQLGIKAGDATLEYKGDTYLAGKKYTLITFTARGFNFFDEERIYADPVTLLPFKVLRELNILGNKESIVEEYLSEDGFVRVSKTAEGKTTVQHISVSGGGAADNIYTFLYRIRRQAQVKSGAVFDLHLPTMTLKLQGVQEVKFNALGKVFQSLMFKSVPPKYTIWFDPGPQQLPLRIAGSIGISNTVMVITGYEPK